MKGTRIISSVQVGLALLFLFICITTLLRLHVEHFFYRDDDAFPDQKAQLDLLSAKLGDLQSKVATALKRMQQSKMTETMPADLNAALVLARSERLMHGNLLVEVAASLDLVKTFLKHMKLSGIPIMASREEANATSNLGEKGEQEQEEEEVGPLVNFFEIEEIRKYIIVRENRFGRKNFMGANATYASIGHACTARKADLEQYMDYDVGDFCKDDWNAGQKLMVMGCDPLPRRRCLARAPPYYQKPYPMSQSLWKLPDDRNVRWNNYVCRNFACLAAKSTRKGFFKCAECFNLSSHEAPRWIGNSSTNAADFSIAEVMQIKPGEIRIGLDFSVSVGTFAVRMREYNATIATATLNLGAPFNEMIALRGLIPLYLSINQRLPFFDNTLDILHSNLFLDGWIDHQTLDFILFDWDRVLRPGGLLWIDKFFCAKVDLEDYLYLFLQLHYKKHRWAVVPKIDKDQKEVFFSAVLEKPPRPF
ncbi:hypothetical protein O6H91_23G012000 [Diphasiastrum complanatum]|nr:hypothetical protein O6H91_23G012000 [Diphasiastrum complanatum]